VNFVTSGVSFGIQIRLADFIGINSDSDLPQLYIVTPELEGVAKKYKYSDEPVEELTNEKVRNFLNDFRSERLERIFKSRPIPDVVTPPNKVREVVGQTWERDVMDPSRDVFVTYVSPFCRECRELKPVLDELAGLTPEDLLIVEFDGDSNEVEGLSR